MFSRIRRGALGCSLICATSFAGVIGAPSCGETENEQPAKDGVVLESGQPIERMIASGEVHRYLVDVPSGYAVSGIVDQRGVDVSVTLFEPSGVQVRTIDSPNGPLGPEPWTIAREPAGTWILEVMPIEPEAKGNYEIRIDEIITIAQYKEREAQMRYQSPRMLALWRDYDEKGSVAIEQFAAAVNGKAPIVEPIPNDPRGDVLVTYLWLGGIDVPSVQLLGAPTVKEIEPMQRFERSGLWFFSIRAPKDLRHNYGFIPSMPFDPQANDEDTQEVLVRDPWNPNLFTDQSHLELPDAPKSPWLLPVDETPRGRVEELTMDSQVLGESRQLGVYLPAQFDPTVTYPIVIFFDGEQHGLSKYGEIQVPTIMDSLSASGKITPAIGVLIASGGTRFRDLSMSSQFCDFLANELLPWLSQKYSISSDPARVTLVGESLGGLEAATCAFQYSDRFGNVLAQSSSFGFAPDLMVPVPPYWIEPGALIRDFVATEKKPIRFWFTIGRFESQIPIHRHMRDVLFAKGYSLHYEEYSGNHNAASWRERLPEGLMAILGKDSTGR